MKETLRADIAGDPRAAGAAAAGAGAEPRGDRRGEDRSRGGGRLDAAAPGRPAGHVRLAVEKFESRSAAETEALGARVAERLNPGDVVVVSGEVGAGKTTLIRGACRALGVDGAGHLADLHDRPALRRRPPAGLPPRPLPAREPRRRGPGPARRLPRSRRASPSSSGPPPAADGWGGRRSRSGSRTPTASAAGSRSSGSAADAAATPSQACFGRENAACSIGALELDPRREGPNEGTQSACGGVGGDWAAGERGAGLRWGGGLQALRGLRDLPQRQSRARLPEGQQEGRLLQKPQRRTSTTRSASSSRAAKTSAPKPRKPNRGRST